MRRPPFWPTLVVALAALLMVRLGLWQLHRRAEKQTLLAHYTDNLARPPIALAGVALDDAALYRRVGAHCLQPIGWQIESGRTVSGATGWRHIALCRTGAEGPGFAADMGVSQSPTAPDWRGGPVRGRLIWRPSAQPLIARLWGAPPDRFPMIVAVTAAPGLMPSAEPDPEAIPNNHLSYAVHWFVFAGLALGIYALALRRRSVARGRPPG